jgi:meiotic recombination protein DMC1
MTLVENLGSIFTSGDYRLLIIDSIISLYRVEFTGRGELAERQNALAKMLNQCLKLAEGLEDTHYLELKRLIEFKNSTFAFLW